LATFCSSDELIVVTTSCLVSKFLQQNPLSFYEREAGDIPAGLAPPMARALGVSVDELLGETEKKRRAGAGLTGRMRHLFEAASKLPRSQQEKIAAVIEAFVNQHSERET
jgi:hypothetical protein